MTLRQQVFVSPGTWTMPSSVTSVDVFLVGGGAKFSTFTAPAPLPSGGPTVYPITGNGGLVRYEQSVPVTGPVPVTVGAGGSSPTLVGGSSSFGPGIVATGGGGYSPRNASNLSPSISQSRAVHQGNYSYAMDMFLEPQYFAGYGIDASSGSISSIEGTKYGVLKSNTGCGGTAPVVPGGGVSNGSDGIVVVRWLE